MPSKDFIDSFIHSSLEELKDIIVPDATAQLRGHADSFGWPSDVISQLKVVKKPDGKHYVYAPPHLKDRVMDLNFGTTSVPLSPAITTFSLGGMDIA